jgi:hypothetical protein
LLAKPAASLQAASGKAVEAGVQGMTELFLACFPKLPRLAKLHSALMIPIPIEESLPVMKREPDNGTSQNREQGEKSSAEIKTFPPRLHSRHRSRLGSTRRCAALFQLRDADLGCL